MQALELDDDTRNELIPAPLWERARALAAPYAAGICASYVEVRLGPQRDPQTDFMFALNLDEALSRGDPGVSRLWDRSTRAAGRFPFSMVWLEFDDVLGDRAPVPSPSVCLVDDYRDWSQPLAAVDDRRSTLLARAFDGLGGDPTLLERARRCLAGLNIIHASRMSRTPPTHKLYGVVHRDRLSHLLADVGWRGPLAEIDELLQRWLRPQWCDGDLYLDLTLDSLTDPDGNRLGFVLPQQYLLRADPDPQRTAFTRACVEGGLCTPAQADALRRWPRREQLEIRGDLVVSTRWLDFKVVWDPRAGPSLKAYLGFATRPCGLFG